MNVEFILFDALVSVIIVEVMLYRGVIIMNTQKKYGTN